MGSRLNRPAARRAAAALAALAAAGPATALAEPPPRLDTGWMLVAGVGATPFPQGLLHDMQVRIRPDGIDVRHGCGAFSATGFLSEDGPAAFRVIEETRTRLCAPGAAAHGPALIAALRATRGFSGDAMSMTLSDYGGGMTLRTGTAVRVRNAYMRGRFPGLYVEPANPDWRWRGDGIELGLTWEAVFGAAGCVRFAGSWHMRNGARDVHLGVTDHVDRRGCANPAELKAGMERLERLAAAETLDAPDDGRQLILKDARGVSVAILDGS